jgi:hypothetical protein
MHRNIRQSCVHMAHIVAGLSVCLTTRRWLGTPAVTTTQRGQAAVPSYRYLYVPLP